MRLTQVRDIAPPVNRLTAGKKWLSEVGEGINGSIDLRTCSQATKHPIDIYLAEGLHCVSRQSTRVRVRQGLSIVGFGLDLGFHIFEITARHRCCTVVPKF